MKKFVKEEKCHRSLNKIFLQIFLRGGTEKKKRDYKKGLIFGSFSKYNLTQNSKTSDLTVFYKTRLRYRPDAWAEGRFHLVAAGRSRFGQTRNESKGSVFMPPSSGCGIPKNHLRYLDVVDPNKPYWYQARFKIVIYFIGRPWDLFVPIMDGAVNPV